MKSLCVFIAVFLALGLASWLIPMSSQRAVLDAKERQGAQLHDMSTRVNTSKKGTAYSKPFFLSTYLAPTAKPKQSKRANTVTQEDENIIKVMGIMKSTQGWRAHMLLEDSGLSEWVGLNEEFGEWRVVEITPNEVVLSMDNVETRFNLFQSTDAYSGQDKTADEFKPDKVRDNGP